MSNRPQIILASTRNELKIINDDLHKKCGKSYNLKMLQYRYRESDAAVFDETSSEYDILLCLYHGPKCVSSVTGRYNKTANSIEILSKTATEYEGLKYNLYLRAAFIYLMCFVRPTIKTIFSYSLNPISTYAMYKHYHASNSDLQEYVKDNHLTPETITLMDAQKFHAYYNKKHNTVESAREELENTLEEYTLEELGWETEENGIEFIMATTVKSVALSLDLESSEVKDHMLRKLLQTQIKCLPLQQSNYETDLQSPKSHKRTHRNDSSVESPRRRTVKKTRRSKT